MFYVLRNGQYLETEKMLFGDVRVQKRPHKNAFLKDDEWIIDAYSLFVELDKKEAEQFLNSTDWKIIRHKEQQDLGIETSLSQDEYLNLIKERQERRNILNGIAE